MYLGQIAVASPEPTVKWVEKWDVRSRTEGDRVNIEIKVFLLVRIEPRDCWCSKLASKFWQLKSRVCCHLGSSCNKRTRMHIPFVWHRSLPDSLSTWQCDARRTSLRRVQHQSSGRNLSINSPPLSWDNAYEETSENFSQNDVESEIWCVLFTSLLLYSFDRLDSVKL